MLFLRIYCFCVTEFKTLVLNIIKIKKSPDFIMTDDDKGDLWRQFL